MRGSQNQLLRRWISAAGRDTSIDCATSDPGYGYHWWIHTVDGYEAVVGSGFGGQRILSIPELDITAVVVHDTRREIAVLRKEEERWSKRGGSRHFRPGAPGAWVEPDRVEIDHGMSGTKRERPGLDLARAVDQVMTVAWKR